MNVVAISSRAPRASPWLWAAVAARLHDEAIGAGAEDLVLRLFRTEGRSLVRLARLFVDDRDAAEDIVQEAFLRLARHAGNIDSIERAPAYLRSIVLNLARDHNRRGLVSLRHRATSGHEIDVDVDAVGDQLVRSEEHQRVIDAVRRLPIRQRDCITLRYFEEMSIDQIAKTLGLSANSVKTHLRRDGCARSFPGGDVNDTALEQRLIDAFSDARASVQENPDLFARVTLSLEESAARRRWRWRMAGWLALFVLANAALALSLSDIDNRRINMDWWVIELITNIVLVALAVGLGPFIKRFGRSYAADVFRANPRTGKSYLVLTDVAYYLIFTSFVLFTVTFVEPDDWVNSTGAQLKHEVARIGGILLIMGILHAANVVALPIIGGLLSSNRQLDEGRPAGPGGGAPPLGPGTWILHVEPAPGQGVPDPDTNPRPE